MLVLDQRQTDMPVAVFAEADAGSHRDLGFLKQQLTELQAAEMGELRRDRRPGEHAGGRAGNLPTGGGQMARTSATQSCGPLSAAAAATWIGVKAP